MEMSSRGNAHVASRWLIVGMVGLGVPASGNLLFYESFEGDSFVAGQTVVGVASDSPGALGQAGAWAEKTGATASRNIQGTGLAYAGGSVAVNGGGKSVLLANTGAGGNAEVGVNVDLGTWGNEVSSAEVGANGKWYLSFLIHASHRVNSYKDANVGQVYGNFTGSGGTSIAGGFDQGPSTGINQAQVQAPHNQTVYTGSFAAGKTYFMVYEIASTGSGWSAAKLFVNPTSTTYGEDTATVSATPNQNYNIGGLKLRINGLATGESMAVDEIRMGTTWASVVPAYVVPTPKGTLVLLK